MTFDIERSRDCPTCGSALANEETSCPKCGNELAKSVKKPAKGKGKASKASKVPCPYCGELISKRSKKCPSCRTVLKTSPVKVSVQSVEGTASEPKPDLVAQALVAGNEPEQPVIASCSGVPEKEEPKNPEPGPLAEDAMKTGAPVVLIESPPVIVSPGVVEDQNKSVELAAPVEPTPVEEPHVAIECDGKTVEPMTPADIALKEELSKLAVDETKTTEPVAPVNPVIADVPPVKCEEDKNVAVFVALIDSTISTTSSEPVCATEGSGVESCQVCGSIVPKDTQKCPVCHQNCLDMPLLPERGQPAAVSLHTQHPEETAIPISEAEKKAARPIRKRKLKSAKCVPIPTVNNSMS